MTTSLILPHFRENRSHFTKIRSAKNALFSPKSFALHKNSQCEYCLFFWSNRQYFVHAKLVRFTGRCENAFRTIELILSWRNPNFAFRPICAFSCSATSPGVFDRGIEKMFGSTESVNFLQIFQTLNKIFVSV